MKIKCKSPPSPPYKESPGLLTGMKGWGGYKAGEKHIFVSACNFVRGNVTMVMGGLNEKGSELKS